MMHTERCLIYINVVPKCSSRFRVRLGIGLGFPLGSGLGLDLRIGLGNCNLTRMRLLSRQQMGWRSSERAREAESPRRGDIANIQTQLNVTSAVHPGGHTETRIGLGF